MGLVEETANYLDGPGREDARVLDRHGAIAYATESMRLTTRLMQLASWLLLQRAIGAGELTGDDARKEKHRISLADIGRGHPLTGSEQLPESLTQLVERSLQLHHRILKLDAMLAVKAKAGAQRKSPHRTARPPRPGPIRRSLTLPAEPNWPLRHAIMVICACNADHSPAILGCRSRAMCERRAPVSP